MPSDPYLPTPSPVEAESADMSVLTVSNGRARRVRARCELCVTALRPQRPQREPLRRLEVLDEARVREVALD